MSEGKIVVRGETTLGYADNLLGLSRFLALFHAAVAVLMIVTLLAIRAWFMTDEDWLRLRYEPLAAAGEAFAENGPLVLGALLLVFFGGLLWNWLCFRKIPQASLHIAIEADEERMVTRDAAGLELSIPWRSVVKTRDTKRALFMKIDAGAWRFLPWRAVASEQDRERLRRWAKRLPDNGQGCAAK